MNKIEHLLLLIQVILAIVSFSFGRFDEMFDWTTHSGYLYLPSWVREIGAMMQLLPILLVPFVAVIQSCRYFMNSSSGERLHEVKLKHVFLEFESHVCISSYMSDLN